MSYLVGREAQEKIYVFFWFSALLDFLKVLRIEFNGLALDETGLLYYYWCIFMTVNFV